MTRRITLNVATSIFAAVGFGFLALDRTLSADLEHILPEADSEQYRPAKQNPNVRVISGDQTARFVSVGLNKSVLIELPGDFTELLVANTAIAIARTASKRRAYIIGVAPGRTNIIFTDDDARPVAAVDVNVTPKELPPAPLQPSGVPVNQVVIYRGTSLLNSIYLSCTRTECLQNLNSKADTNDNKTGPASD